MAAWSVGTDMHDLIRRSGLERDAPMLMDVEIVYVHVLSKSREMQTGLP
jgi:hypothetical protein